MTKEQYFTKHPKNLLDEELVAELEKYSDEDDYVIGTMLDMKTEADKRKLIEYIRNGNNVSYENIILYALDLSLHHKSCNG